MRDSIATWNVRESYDKCSSAGYGSELRRLRGRRAGRAYGLLGYAKNPLLNGIMEVKKENVCL